ncbi:hypothetical protein [Sulfuracidifex metallicus]|jgi:hypothetical protein|uniref:Uncharacterized protein n=1 Tax=Sulfuracidifex metallicus DSM 6482 = JCM 9184 TaxID=523847 RepID=A0A6A9QUH6_SULME|nr:hypothetical protein [Sulfuracidifex metallicus]MUN29483.1 hypothetical protein [Sulfuracidifex metallicus DSM 6482 = JCM 9184]WOE50007.1 hypothetical protein RQ359_001505 [Sulfuracidifex metallicus DSM 6482 = JCM 9184]
MKVILENPEFTGDIIEVRLNGESIMNFSPSRINSRKIVMDIGGIPRKGNNILEIITSKGGYIRRYIEI